VGFRGGESCTSEDYGRGGAARGPLIYGLIFPGDAAAINPAL